MTTFTLLYQRLTTLNVIVDDKEAKPQAPLACSLALLRSMETFSLPQRKEISRWLMPHIFPNISLNIFSHIRYYDIRSVEYLSSLVLGSSLGKSLPGPNQARLWLGPSRINDIKLAAFQNPFLTDMRAQRMTLWPPSDEAKGR